MAVRVLICVLFYTCFPDTSQAQEAGAISESNLPCNNKQLFKNQLFPCLTDSIPGKSRFTVYCLVPENTPDTHYISYLETEVCNDRNCKVARVWLYWSKTGLYKGYEPPCHYPLTKSDHENFSPEDYEQLHQLLSDPDSPLKKLSFEDLTSTSVQETTSSTERSNVDAISQATTPALSEIVVKNAAFTCYSLWHLVYGELGAAIQLLVNDRTSEKFLENLLISQNEQELAWVINYISNNPEKYLHYIPRLITIIRKGPAMLRESALNFFTPDIAAPNTLGQLCSTLADLDVTAQSQVLEKMGQLDPDVGTITQVLRLYEQGRLDVTLLHYVFELVDEQYVNDPNVRRILDQLKKSSNPYVQNMTLQLLRKSNP